MAKGLHNYMTTHLNLFDYSSRFSLTNLALKRVTRFSELNTTIDGVLHDITGNASEIYFYKRVGSWLQFL